MKYFSIFTGIGGLEFGLEKLDGSECVGFSEIKESSIKCYLSHYPNRKNFGDITKIDPKNLPEFDLLVGGFPCQSFSIAGLRKGFVDTKEKKGQMIFYIYNIILEKKPEFVVLENVKGLLTHDNGKTCEKIFKLLQSAGYYVRCVLLNSLYYGSPQARERIVFLCRRKNFEKKELGIIDGVRRFRDIRDANEDNYNFVSDNILKKIEEKTDRFIILGGYDKVNTLTTAKSSSGRKTIIIQFKNKFRYLTELEGERLQGFPDGWTKTITKAGRWFAIGNAVNCKVSEYLFNNYLKGVWW